MSVFLLIKQRIEDVWGLENLTGLETYCYVQNLKLSVLAYNPDDAILNTKRRMVNVAVENYNEMREDEPLFN